MQKPSIPKGTRDFTPQETANRNYIFDTIKNVFQLFGYQQIETPAMENLSTLLGKYGEEGDKLLFRILNSGDFLSDVSGDELSERNTLKISNKISEKGLRYDLTVPFARFVVQNRDKIAFPFKRFQIQPVWRADRPQKGRYREFYQCDVDVVGSDSLLNEVELVQIIDEVYKRLKINVLIKINNRKILSGIAEIIGQKDKIADITVAIDKMDKIGLEKVNEELIAKGIDSQSVERLQPILLLKGTNAEKLEKLREVLKNSEIGLQGIAELQTIFDLLNTVALATPVELDLTLARGLNYYTGAIFEVKALDVAIGSITGGGRYDNLTGIFGLEGVSGVGISFGADRIYDVLLQLNLFPETSDGQTKVLFACFGENEQRFALSWADTLRQAGINAEIFPDTAKMKKQMTYADNKQIPFVAIVGENELQQQKVMLKNMQTGEQQLVTAAELLTTITNHC
ncbi:histidine--tRNA ligase [Bacteroidia bacterium]|nr:histidine--tRNA ligase [Bacteroidia bacterium]GHV46134.1 histidine--tRNA ligase [Bacteroidia bacterium]